MLETGILEVGEEIIISGPTTGVVEMTIEEIHVDNKSAPKAEKGQYYSIKSPLVRRSDKIYKLIESAAR